ncbi:hypothetical protein CN386_28220, partial [Bacillus cereus]
PTGITGPTGPTGIPETVFGNFYINVFPITQPVYVDVPPDSIIPLDTASEDTSTNFTLAAGQITIPTNGIYLISFSFTVPPANAMNIIIRQNENRLNPIEVMAQGTSDSLSNGSGTGVHRLYKGDKIDLYRATFGLTGVTTQQIGAVLLVNPNNNQYIVNYPALLTLVKIAD